jgi:hypothetical protein
MKVSELIGLLQAMPQDALVVVRGYESGVDNVKGADECFVMEMAEYNEKEYNSQKKSNGVLKNTLYVPGWYDGWYEFANGADETDCIRAVYIQGDTENHDERAERIASEWRKKYGEKVW